MTQTKAEKTMIFNKSAKELREDCAIPMFCDLGPCDYSCPGTCNAVTFSSYPSDFTDEMCDYLDSLESDENIYTDIPWVVEDQMIRGVKYKPKQEKEKPMGKSIEKHYCTKCVHGILCESGELKCNHEAWTTTKDGTYAYPNGLRQIKSRDKPSWCPGFKAMQGREILKMAENKIVTYTDGMVAVESGAIDEYPDVYPFPPSVDMENVLGLVDALGLNFNLGVAVQHIAYAEDSTSNDARIRNLCQARGYIEREIKAVSEK